MYQLFLRRRARRASCVGSSRCRPVEVTLERHYTPRGVVTREVIQRCGCRRPAPCCQRQSRAVTVHPGTPHQRRLDVGVCRGPCGNKGGTISTVGTTVLPRAETVKRYLPMMGGKYLCCCCYGSRTTYILLGPKFQLSNSNVGPIVLCQCESVVRQSSRNDMRDIHRRWRIKREDGKGLGGIICVSFSYQ